MANHVLLFWAGLVLVAVVWVVAMKKLLTRKDILAKLRNIGVAARKTGRTFNELRRKCFHLMGILIPMIYYLGEAASIPCFFCVLTKLVFSGLKYTTWMTQRRASIIMGCLTAYLWLIELGRLVSRRFRVLYNQIFGSMLRQSEKADGSIQVTGTGFYFLGSFLCVFFFDPMIAIAGMLYLILGDLAAALVGVSFGRLKIGRKSIEGTFACFAVCYVIGLVLFWHAPLTDYVCFVGALTASIVELFNPKAIDDNLTIPVSSALSLHLAMSRALEKSHMSFPLPLP